MMSRSTWTFVPRPRRVFLFLRPIGATVARQIPVLKVTRSNRVSVTDLVDCAAVRRYTHRSCAICFLACHPHVGVCVRLKSRWPYHRAGGAPPQAEAMDGKEEVRVVEEEPSWTGGSLESLDVIDKVPVESVKLASD